MNKISTKTCRCINTKNGTIAVKGGIKPVFILEFADDTGELLIKFFNANKTSRGNFSVPRNSDFARLYRITIGENPAARFSRADKLLSHFVGHAFEAECVSAINKRNGFYQKITSIRPIESIVSDEWTQTGHLIKHVRQKTKNCQRTVNICAKNGQLLGNCDSAQNHDTHRLEHDFNPIRHTPYQVETSQVVNKYIFNYIKGQPNQKHPPPDLDLATIEINQHFMF